MTDSVKYEIERADLKRDREGILSVLLSNFPDFNPARYDWLYLNNPCGQAHTFAARPEGGSEIVGCVSIFPRRMVFSGRKYLAGIAGDFAVNRNIRGFLGFQLQRRVITHARESFDFLYSIPNPQSEMVLSRSGFAIIGEISRLARMLKADEKLKSRTNTILARLGAPLANLYLRQALKRRIHLDLTHFDELSPQFFDKCFDDFWNNGADRPGIIGLRDAEYLNWKYCQDPYFHHHIFTIADKESLKILGYIAYHIVEYRCLIDDLQFLPDENICHQLMAHFVWHLSEKKIASVVSLFLADTSLSCKIIKTLKFMEREKEEKLMVYIPPKSSELKDALMNIDNWHILKGDWDI